MKVESIVLSSPTSWASAMAYRSGILANAIYFGGDSVSFSLIGTKGVKTLVLSNHKKLTLLDDHLTTRVKVSPTEVDIFIKFD